MRRVAPIVTAVIFLITLIPPQVAGQVLGDCTVSQGTPGGIQTAINNAQPGAKIVVCIGLYREMVVVTKNGITLEGRGAILDGSLFTGQRFGITIQNGVHDVTVVGFEVRGFKNPLQADASSGIVSGGPGAHANILNNWIHDNSWSGILVGKGSQQAWRIENNTFSGHANANIMIEGASASIKKNQLNDSRYGIVVTGARNVLVSGNTITGQGTAGLLIGPGLGRGAGVNGVVVSDNLIGPNWHHGIWASGLQDATFTNNTVQAQSNSFAGPTQNYRFSQNALGRTFQVPDTTEVDAAFRIGARGNFRAQAADISYTCQGLSCLGWPLYKTLDLLFPSAAAQAPPPGPYDCVTQVSCTPNDILALLDYATLVALNPAAVAEDWADAARLESCNGQPDACLSAAFIESADTNIPYAWNVTIAPGVELRFIETAIRRPGDVYAKRFVQSPLNRAWTPLVVCTLVINGTRNPCLGEPVSFDFGLDVNWTSTTRDRHLSLWHLREPSEDLHLGFQRVHGREATLFKNTTRPHDAKTPLVGTLPTALPPVPDPLRTAYAGNLVLACGIKTTSLAPSGCGTPRLVQQVSDPILEWCTANAPSHDTATHMNVDQEATMLWRWSATCSPASQTQTTNWTTLLTDGDRRELAATHQAYDDAPTTASKQQNLTQAEAILTRAVTRHLGVRVTTEGLPTQVNQSIMVAALPSVVATLPDRKWDAASAYNGEYVYVFGGASSNKIFRINGTTFAVTQLAATLPGAAGQSAVYDGKRYIYIFPGENITLPTGGYVGNYGATFQKIYRFDTLTESVNALSDPVWPPAGKVRAVFDTRDRPYQGCPNGCAYIFATQQSGSAADNIVYKFNPTTETLTELPVTIRHTEHAPIAFDGETAYLLGGASGYGGTWWNTYNTVTGLQHHHRKGRHPPRRPPRRKDPWRRGLGWHRHLLDGRRDVQADQQPERHELRHPLQPQERKLRLRGLRPA